MAGLFPGVCNAQNVDANGRPLANAVLTVYNGGTLQLASCFQDIGLAVGAQNPMTADETARLPIFYVADGVYRIRLVDQNGVLIFDYPQVSSIGASSSGGGGSGVDPTTIFATGDELWRKIGGIRTGWVRENGLTIGSATSGASERANADCQALFLYLWANYTDVSCPVVGGRGVSAAADWGANKQITLPDMRGRGAVGKDGMGNSRANIVPDGNVSSAVSGSADTADTDAAYGGEANHVLVTNELAAHTHGVFLTDPKHTHSLSAQALSTDLSGGIAVGGGGTFGVGRQMSTESTGVTVSDGNGNPNQVASTGGGAGHNTMQPFMLGTWFMKL